MFKLIKYEYRRNITGIAAMLSAVVLLQGFFLFATAKKDVEMVVAAAMLLFAAASICVMGMLLYSVALYSRELNAKTSYLTFMTPNPVAKILGSKLLAALLAGTFFAVVLGAFAAWDFSLMARAFPEIQLGRIALEQVLQSVAATDLATLFTTLAAMGVEFLINFFTVVVVAYLAITLSATALQNKKLKGLVSFVIFLAVMTALEWGTSLLPDGGVHKSLADAMLDAWPRYAAYLAAMVGAFWLSAWLLDHKVSL